MAGKKTGIKVKKRYDESLVLEAAAAVKNGATYKEASEMYKIPVSTINDKVLRKYPSGKSKPGMINYVFRCNTLFSLIIFINISFFLHELIPWVYI